MQQKLVKKDFEDFKEKLAGYEHVLYDTLTADMHVRYVRKEYKKNTSKCTYGIVSSSEAGQPLKMRSYVPYGSNDAPRTWEIKQSSLPYIRFYRKVQKKTT